MSDGEYLEHQVLTALDRTVSEYYGDGPATETIQRQFKELFLEQLRLLGD